MNTGNGEARADINMSPMIDVLLVLLIIFMAITPTQPTALSAAIPRNPPDTANATPENPVVLEIERDGSYRLNSEAVKQSSLHDRLISVFERRGERVLFMKADGSLEYSAVAAAIDAAHSVNIERVALMPR